MDSPEDTKQDLQAVVEYCPAVGAAVLRALIVAVAALWLNACSQEAVMARYEPLQETVLARENIDLLRDRSFDALLAKLDPEIRNDPQMAASLPGAAAYFPDAEPLSVKLVEYNFLTLLPFGDAPSSTRYIIGFEYEFPDIWVVAVATLRSVGAETFLLSIRLFRNSDSLEELNALTFGNKSALHFVFAIIAAAILAFIITTLVACIRTKVPRRRWLWIVFILLGVGQITLNWTTGEIGFGVGVNLLGVSMTKQPYAPWMLQIAFPLGAALFWWRRRGWAERSPADQFA
jgi:hypothetical protein